MVFREGVGWVGRWFLSCYPGDFFFLSFFLFCGTLGWWVLAG